MGELQRSRMIGAAIDAVDEIGYARMTVAEIIARARVSRKTFYEVFTDCEDCFLAVFEQTLTQAMSAVSGAYAEGRGWREGIRSALARLLVLMEERPALARLWIIETPRGGERLLERRLQALAGLASVIDEGRHAIDGRHKPPEIAAQCIVGGVLAMLHMRLLRGGEEPLTDLLGPMMYMIVLPYLGAGHARSELNRATREPPRPRPAKAPPSDTDPLEGLNMRLTYRTARVLYAISQRPGASNREVAESSGVVDQGQISRLLGRLARLKLIENHGLGRERGAANAWELTRRGAEIVRTTRSRGYLLA